MTARLNHGSFFSDDVLPIVMEKVNYPKTLMLECLLKMWRQGVIKKDKDAREANGK
jgi:hypothetical protein